MLLLNDEYEQAFLMSKLELDHRKGALHKKLSFKIADFLAIMTGSLRLLVLYPCCLLL